MMKANSPKLLCWRPSLWSWVWRPMFTVLPIFPTRRTSLLNCLFLSSSTTTRRWDRGRSSTWSTVRYLISWMCSRRATLSRKALTECSYFVVDMNTSEQTFLFLQRFVDILPISGYYYFFLDQTTISSSQQSKILFDHQFFQKVYFVLNYSVHPKICSLGLQCRFVPTIKFQNYSCLRQRNLIGSSESSLWFMERLPISLW